MQFLRICRTCLRAHHQNHGSKVITIQRRFSPDKCSIEERSRRKRYLLAGNASSKHGGINCIPPCSKQQQKKHSTLGPLCISAGPKSDGERRLSSTLYTPPSEGDHVPFVLKPEVDFERIFCDIGELEMNVDARGHEVNISNLVSLWKKLQSLEQERTRIEGERSSVNKRSKQFKRTKDGGSKEQKRELQLLGRSLRDELRQVNASIASVSDEFYPSALKLPNNLHPDVPHGSIPKVLETFGSEQAVINPESTAQQPSPLLTESHSLAHPGFAYLEDEAALLELGLTNWAHRELTAQGFVPLVCPAMFKPIAMEAFGLNPDGINEAYAIETQENVQHLTGVSPLGFIAHYMMSVMEVADLPYRCFTTGRSYNSQSESSHFQGLHNSFQSQKVELCGLCESNLAASNALYTQFISTARSLLSNLPMNFRIVEVPSACLLPSMYRKCAIEVWIPNIGEFKEVACVFSCTDYVSSRVKMRYPAIPTQRAAQSRQRKFLHTVHCTALDTSVLLAAMLPNIQIPDILKPHMPQPLTSKV